MVRQVGAVEVEVRANLDNYVRGLNKAEQEAKDFNTQTTRTMTQGTQVTERLTEAVVELHQQSKGSGIASLNTVISLVSNTAKTALGPLAGFIGLLGIGGMALAVRQAAVAFGEFEQSQIDFAARLNVTQGALGLTQERINELSREISTRTLTSISELREASIALGQTGQIFGQNLERALRLLPDLAMRVGGMTQAVQLLGEALRKPDENIRSLRDAGIRFTDSQREYIEGSHLFEGTLERQNELLRILETQIGGEAEARGRGVAGGFRRLANAVQSFFVSLGGGADRLLGLSESARTLGGVLESMERQLFPQTAIDRIRQAEVEVARLNESLEMTARQVSQAAGGGLAGAMAIITSASVERAQAALAEGMARRDLLRMGQDELAQEAERIAAGRSRELQNRRINDSLEDHRGILENLRESTNRAELATREWARQNRIAFDSPAARAYLQLQRDIARERRRLARADQPDILELENERIRRQTELLRFNSEERRVQQDLLQIELRLKRRGIEVDQEQLQALGNRIRLMRELQRVTQVIEEASTSLFNNMANALAEFAATGKFDFKQLADSIVRDLVRIALQAAVVRPIVQAITGFVNPMVTSSAGVSTGSTVIPTFQHGGSFMVPGSGGTDKPALLVGLTPGERVDVTPAGRARRGAGGEVTVVNNLNSSRDFEVRQEEREGPDGSRIIEQTFNEVMRRIGRGDGDSTFGARFGVRPRTVTR